jgi:hypothetical protein
VRPSPNPYLVALLACQTLFAQHVHPMSAPGTGPGTLPVVVDGSKNPQDIPDSLAYSHFFTAVAAHPSPTPQEQGRQTAQLLPLNLSVADRQNLVQALAAFRTGLDPIEAALLAQPTPAQVAGLRQQKATLVAGTMTNIGSALTADGFGKLDQYVKTHVKQHIVIYGSAMQH